MVTRPEQFDNLILDTGQLVLGLQGGLAMKGHGTFKFIIKDGKEMVHLIKMPNSMYVPNHEYCLLWPQPWAQEVKDIPQGTRMENEDHGVVLIWG
jgi:hypothetical protein